MDELLELDELLEDAIEEDEEDVLLEDVEDTLEDEVDDVEVVVDWAVDELMMDGVVVEEVVWLDDVICELVEVFEGPEPSTK